MSDVPETLDFVDPLETDDTFRVCLWASPGQGKSVAAASAPSPILVLTADRPSAYRFARKHHGHTAQTLRETRFVDASSLDAVFRYLSSDEGKDVRTVVIDPFSNVYDQLVDTAPTVMIKGRRSPDYQSVNKKILGFVKSLRRFDINVVLVAHEKLNDGDDGDGKLYPSLGGPSLINKTLAEMDIVAHIERHVRKADEDGDVEQLWVGQLQPRDNLVCKESTGALGDRRVADLSRWFQVASDALAPDDSDLPFVETEAELEHAEPEEVL
jgi:hypothetical protein